MEKKPKNQIYLEVINHLPSPVQISLMGDPFNPGNDQLNATNRYEWDMTGETFIGVTQVYLSVGSSISGPFNAEFKPFSGSTFADLVAVLTSFGYGAFFYTGTTVYTYMNNNVFFDIIRLT